MDLAARLVLELKHQAVAVVEVDRILSATSLLHCLVQQKPLLLAVEELVGRL